MAITLTCSCGRQQFVAIQMAGQTLACRGCGRALAVPAMGVLATPQAKPRPTAKPARTSSSTRAAIVLIATGLLAIGTAGGLAWWMSQRALDEPKQIAQLTESEPVERRPVESLTPVARKTPAPGALLERTSPESNGSPEPGIERVKPLEVMKPLIESVQPRVDLPKTVTEPVPAKVDPPKPKDSPPVAETKPANLMAPLKLVWKLKADDSFFQELIVTQKPNFKVQGILVASVLQYQVVSRFTVKKANADGSMVVEQKIVSAKLLFADELTRPTVAGSVAQMPGTVYTLHLSPQMDVTKLEGDIAAPKVGAVQVGGGLGMQLTSLLDRDGWRELAQATFFQIDQPLKAGARWSKPMTHNWGGLGFWSGQINYAYVGQQGNMHKVAYGLQLAYQAPADAKVGLMAVQGAAFKHQEAGGNLMFDAVQGKVVSAEERFRVTGVLSVNLLGQNTTIEIDEDQHFLIRIHDKWEMAKK